MVHKITSVAELNRYLLNTDKFVCLKFGAEWCGACKKINPVYKNISEYLDKSGKSDRIILLDIDCDLLDKVAGIYNIEYLPTFVVQKGGKIIKRLVSPQKNELLSLFSTK